MINEIKIYLFTGTNIERNKQFRDNFESDQNYDVSNLPSIKRSIVGFNSPRVDQDTEYARSFASNKVPCYIVLFKNQRGKIIHSLIHLKPSGVMDALHKGAHQLSGHGRTV